MRMIRNVLLLIRARLLARAASDASLADRTLILDYSIYERCALYNCDIWYFGSDSVRFTGNHLTDCRLHFSGFAGNALTLLQDLDGQRGGVTLLAGAFPNVERAAALLPPR